mmetsp:Transcript_28027/g.39602  ORF Transcript_28027/g.39602 Transcript_28027/m.39602 type:complete len:384 (+) Transcript_28027:199-1350(+)
MMVPSHLLLLIPLLASTCGAFVLRPSQCSKRHTNFIFNAAVVEDPTFSPPDTSSISEEACIATASRMKRILVPVSENVSETGNVGISYVHWPAKGSKKSSLPLILVHGFDSSCLEYRRIGSKLAEKGIDTYAVDLLGWGYSQLDGVASFSADSKVEALRSFTNQVLGGKPFAIAGASLGGASAIELASSQPETCKAIILIDAQGFVDGVGPMAALPTPLARLGVQVLKSVPLRSSANQMSYFDKETYATEDALKIGRLHCLRDGWNDALVGFMQSGGFSPSKKVPTIQAPALVLWGRQDGILDGEEFANKFVQTLPNAKLQWIEECGHVPHLEQPENTAEVILEFLTSDSFVSEGGGLPQSVAVGGAVASAAAVVAEVATNFF